MAITDPTDITGCVVWLDPGTISATDGDPIGSWSDQSGNGNDATASGVDRPTYRDGSAFNHGNPTLEFENTGHRIEVAADASLDNANVTYAVVCRLENLNANTDSSWIINKVNTNPSTVGLRIADSDIADAGKYETFFRLDGSESTVRDLESRGPYRQAWTVFLFRYDGTTGEMYIDHDLSDSVSVSGNIDADSSGKLTIGNHNSLDLAWRGHIGEVVVYDNAISNADRDDLIDWLLTKYSNSEYTKTASILTTGIRHARIRSASDTGESTNQMLVVTTSGAINHYTSPTSDPHNWTLANSSVIPTDANYRTMDFIVVSGTWYVYVDRAFGNGEIELWTGAAVTSLTEHGSSPVISGSAGDHPRTPGVIEESGSWTMLVDVRTDELLGGQGYLDRYTSSNGTSWTKDTVNSPVVSSTGNGFESTDITHPFIYKRGTNDYLIVYAGYNEDHPLESTYFPHELGLLTSTDLISFTRSDKNPILTMGHAASSFDVTLVANPCIFNDGTNLTLYYSGRILSGGAIQVGYATGDPANLVSRFITQTFLTDLVEQESFFILAADRLFFAGAFPPEGQDVQHNYFFEDVADTFFTDAANNLGGYNQVLEIIQYLGLTGPRVFSNAADAMFSSALGQEQILRIAEQRDAANAFAWLNHDDRTELDLKMYALLRAYSTIDTMALSQTISGSDVQEVFQFFENLDSTLDASGTEYDRMPSDSVIKDHVAFKVTGGPDCPEKEFAPFAGSSGDASYGTVDDTKPVLTKSTLTLTYPRVSPTLTLVLKNPEFGDQDNLSFAKIDRTTRGGDRKIFAENKWGETQRLQITIGNLSECKVPVADIVAFLNASLGKEVGLLDWHGRQWKGVIITPDTDIIQEATGTRVTITLEGELV